MTDRLVEWLALVDACYPEADAEDWDATGLQVGDPEDEVSAVLVVLDVTAATLDEAAARGADLVLAHHPLLFRPLARLTPATPAGGLALRAARAGIAVLAAHTNFDVGSPGTSTPAAALLGLDRPQPLTEGGLGLVGDLPFPGTLDAVAGDLARGLPAPTLRVAGDLDSVVRRVAVCGGAGDALVGPALAARADVLVTGDLRHHVALDALALGLALIDAGHHATEAAALPALREVLAAAAGRRGLTARLLASAVNTDPWTVPRGSA